MVSSLLRALSTTPCSRVCQAGKYCRSRRSCDWDSISWPPPAHGSVCFHCWVSPRPPKLCPAAKAVNADVVEAEGIRATAEDDDGDEQEEDGEIAAAVVVGEVAVGEDISGTDGTDHADQAAGGPGLGSLGGFGGSVVIFFLAVAPDFHAAGGPCSGVVAQRASPPPPPPPPLELRAELPADLPAELLQLLLLLPASLAKLQTLEASSVLSASALAGAPSTPPPAAAVVAFSAHFALSRFFRRRRRPELDSFVLAPSAAAAAIPAAVGVTCSALELPLVP